MKSFSETVIYCGRLLTVLAVVMAMLNISATVAFASPPGSAVAFGTLKVSGVVTVNDLHALTGQTFLSGGRTMALECAAEAPSRPAPMAWRRTVATAAEISAGDLTST